MSTLEKFDELTSILRDYVSCFNHSCVSGECKAYEPGNCNKKAVETLLELEKLILSEAIEFFKN